MENPYTSELRFFTFKNAYNIAVCPSKGHSIDGMNYDNVQQVEGKFSAYIPLPAYSTVEDFVNKYNTEKYNWKLDNFETNKNDPILEIRVNDLEDNTYYDNYFIFNLNLPFPVKNRYFSVLPMVLTPSEIKTLLLLNPSNLTDDIRNRLEAYIALNPPPRERCPNVVLGDKINSNNLVSQYDLKIQVCIHGQGFNEILWNEYRQQVEKTMMQLYDDFIDSVEFKRVPDVNPGTFPEIKKYYMFNFSEDELIDL